MKGVSIGGGLALVAVLLGLAACGGGGGGGGGSSPPPEAQVTTLAYVVSRCHEEKGGRNSSFSQTLWIRQGDREPVKIVEYALGQSPIGGFCTLFGQSRFGSASTVVGGFQRLGVSPDGSLVVFEVTDDFSVLAHVIPEDQQGFFVVHADGGGLHKVAEHGTDAPFRVDWSCVLGNTGCSGGFTPSALEFSPDGRRVLYTDLGPSDAGDEAPQVFTLDVTTGERQQVTHLPRLPECRGQSDESSNCVQPSVLPISGLSFLDDTNIAYGRARGYNGAGGGVFTVTLAADGIWAEPKAVQVVAGGDGVVLPVFEITGAEAYALDNVVPGRTPVNGGETVVEAFVIELPEPGQRPEGRVLQLTNFGRSDTGGVRIAIDRQHVFFRASANPLGTNRSTQCEWFSIDRLAGDLQQLTSFNAVGDRPRNCGDARSPGCTIFGGSRVDLSTGSLVFDSTCDPLGTNPHDGDQLFALRPDGSGLRQLTYTQGVTNHPDRSVDVELPGPFHLPSRLR